MGNKDVLDKCVKNDNLDKIDNTCKSVTSLRSEIDTKVRVVNDVLDKCVKNDNLDNIDNTCKSVTSLKNEIDKNGAAISKNSNVVAKATKCTAVDWSYSCCTSANPCSFGKGDCDSSDHSTCSGDLRCG